MSDTSIVAPADEANRNCYPPVEIHWVSNDPRYKDGVHRLVFSASGITLFTIIPRRQNLGWFGPVEYRYEVTSSLRWACSGFRIGGVFDTIEEAKEYGETTAAVIIRGRGHVVTPKNKSSNSQGDE